MEERRMHQRVRVVFPAGINVAKEDDARQKDNLMEIVDLSETGFKLVTNRTISSPVKIYVNLSPCYSDDPQKATGMLINSEAVWKNTIANKNTYGCRILKTDPKNENTIRNIVRYELEKLKKSGSTQPRLEIKREPHSCNMYAVDLTVGCENDCKYCHFAAARELSWREKYPFAKEYPIPVDISPLYSMKEFPESVVYLSPSSDAFAPKARELTHELLSYLLPKGVIFTISTKCIIPDKTIELLKKYKHQLEGVGMGITNFNEERNRQLEPGAPPARERLEHMKKLKEIGCFMGVRMDPMFPVIDDNEEELEKTIEILCKAGARHIAGTYVFTFGPFLKSLKKIPILKNSVRMLNEVSYPMGGKALSVPLDHRKAVYEKMNLMCKKWGVHFSTCGCKELRLREEGYALVCRNLAYYNK